MAGEMMLRRVLEGSLVMQEFEVERRPYHRNCSCALHDLKGSVCSLACSRSRNIKLPKKKSWNHCSLSMANSQFSSLPGGSLVRNMESKTSMEFCYIDDDGQNMSEIRR